MNARRSFIVSLLALSVLLFILRPDSEAFETNHLDSQDIVLAFGDSLTYGYGAHSKSYPVQLQLRIKREVINGGVSGETSSQGLKRLPALLQKYHPKLVILCHGGNDIIRQQSKKTLRENLLKMIQMSKTFGAEILLVAVPDFHSLGLTTESLYEEVAKQENVLYEGKILTKIENDPALKSDRIHPNAKGYALMAEAFAEILKKHQIVK
ncbi:MAG: arylesterase [Sulfurovum sp.]|nr:MAG: arylesterase [Sulfurovum sp.]